MSVITDLNELANLTNGYFLTKFFNRTSYDTKVFAKFAKEHPGFFRIILQKKGNGGGTVGVITNECRAYFGAKERPDDPLSANLILCELLYSAYVLQTKTPYRKHRNTLQEDGRQLYLLGELSFNGIPNKSIVVTLPIFERPAIAKGYKVIIPDVLKGVGMITLSHLILKNFPTIREELVIPVRQEAEASAPVEEDGSQFEESDIVEETALSDEAREIYERLKNSAMTTQKP